MSDEIKKIQEQATELGIYKILRNVASKGKNGSDFCEATWEGCQIKFREKQSPDGKATIAALLRGSFVTIITMPNNVVLYRCEESLANSKTQYVTNFRHGAWVERIKTYSEQITLERKQSMESRAQKKQEEALKPFTQIDF